MGIHQNLCIPQYSRVPTRVRDGHGYHIYPREWGRVSYYMYS